MSILRNIALAATTTAIIGAGAAVAQDNFKFPLKARQGQMAIIAMNLGALGAMAKGEMEYDAAVAQAAADNLVAVSTIGQGALWPEGSDGEAIEGTTAKSTIWSDNADFLAKWGDFGKNATAMAAAAGGGLDSLRPAMGGLGGTCKACHDKFRIPKE